MSELPIYPLALTLCPCCGTRLSQQEASLFACVPCDVRVRLIGCVRGRGERGELRSERS